jgi:hypothetical protein
MRRSLRWSLAAVVGLAAAVSLLVIPALGNSPVFGPVGTIRVQLNADGDKVIFDPDAPGPNLVQTLSSSNCKLSSSGDSLLTIVGSSSHSSKKPYAGLKDHRIGVGQIWEGSGEPCARINRDLGQKLTLSLAGSLAGQSIGYAEIDLGFKFNGNAELELRKSGQLVDTVIVPCTGGSDCGPDSGKNDNERVILYLAGNPAPAADHWQSFAIDGVFDTIIIKPGNASHKGAISLEAGFNGSAPGPLGISLGGIKDTLFQLVEPFDGEIPCGGAAVLGGDDDPTFDVRRGFDTGGGCKGPVPGLLYTFDAGEEGEGVLFVDFVTAPVEGPAVAQFLEEITWTFDDPPALPEQFHTLLYDDHVIAIDERVMPWCLRDPRVEGALPSPLDPATVLPSGHTSCLIDSASSVRGDDFIVEDIIYNIGDGKRSRG